MNRKLLLLILGLTLLFGGLGAQTTPLTEEEIANLKNLAEYNTRWSFFLNVWAFLGPLLAAIVTWLGLRKKIEDWAESQITKKASEKFGVDWAIVKKLVDKETHILNVRQKRIAVINKKDGKRNDLVAILTKSGFDEKNIHFYTLDKMKDFEENNHDIILLDNFDGSLSESEMEEQITKKLPKFNFLVFTNVDVGFYSKYGPKVKIVKNPNYIVDNLEQLLL